MHHVGNKQHRQLTMAQALPIPMGGPDPINQLHHPHLHKPMKNKRNIIYSLNFAGTHGMVPLDEKCYTNSNSTGFSLSSKISVFPNLKTRLTFTLLAVKFTSFD
jgi:hypothetical protein